MNTVLIIICIIFCAAVIFGAMAHFGVAIQRDKEHRIRMARHHRGRRAGRREQQNV